MQETKSAAQEQEFAVSMQELSAEAEKTLPVLPVGVVNSFTLAEEKQSAIAERLQGLENLP
jgi:hypothetical protein